MEVYNDLLLKIEGTADWRMQKANEFPQDAARNEIAAEKLRKLHEHIKGLPIDHQLFQLEDQIIQYSQKHDDWDIIYRLIEERNRDVGAYGFQDQCTPETWVEKQISNLKRLSDCTWHPSNN